MTFYIRDNSLVDMNVLIQADLLLVHRSISGLSGYLALHYLLAVSTLSQYQARSSRIIAPLLNVFVNYVYVLCLRTHREDSCSPGHAL